jgi:hypothetical protein
VTNASISIAREFSAVKQALGYRCVALERQWFRTVFG